jgi:hypothetical protein
MIALTSVSLAPAKPAKREVSRRFKSVNHAIKHQTTRDERIPDRTLYDTACMEPTKV